MYCNIEVRSHSHCCSGKATNILYSECMFVALVIQHAMNMCHIVICGLSGSTIFFHITSQTARFSKKKSYWTRNVWFDFLYNFCLKCFSLYEKLSAIWSNVHRSSWKYPLFSSDFDETWIFSTYFRKCTQISNCIKKNSETFSIYKELSEI